jgi:hypothetical protein
LCQCDRSSVGPRSDRGAIGSRTSPNFSSCSPPSSLSSRLRIVTSCPRYTNAIRSLSTTLRHRRFRCQVVLVHGEEGFACISHLSRYFLGRSISLVVLAKSRNLHLCLTAIKVISELANAEGRVSESLRFRCQMRAMGSGVTGDGLAAMNQ